MNLKMLINLCQGTHLKKKLKRANINKINRFTENTTKMTFIEKKTFRLKNNIGIIRNLEIKFHDENCYNYNNISFICILQSNISSVNQALVFLVILKLFKISGLQTKMAFNQRFK